jgi:hypothetical protein
MNTNSLNRENKLFSLFVATIIFVFTVAISQATTLSFYNIENNTVDISDQLGVDVKDEESGITFTFYNNVGIQSSVTDIYFDQGSLDLFSGFTMIDSFGALFSPTATPGNLPGGSAIGFSADYSFDSSGNPTNGLDASTDYVTFLATVGADYTSYDDFITALLNGDARIGLHIQGYEDGESDSYVSQVPIPAAGILFASALVAAGVFGRRKKKVTRNSMVGAFTRAS